MVTSAAVLLIPLLVDCKCSMFDFDGCRSVRSLSQTFCVVARSQDHLVLIEIDVLSGCDCGGRELQCNGIVSQWEEFRSLHLFEIFRNLFHSSLLLENMNDVRLIGV